MKAITAIFAGLFPVAAIIAFWFFIQLAESDTEHIRLRASLENQASQLLSLRKKLAAKEKASTAHSLHMHKKPTPNEEIKEEEGEEEEQEVDTATRAERRVETIARVVTLTPKERDELLEIYGSDEEVPLSDVLGKERAEFIRNEQRKAYSRAEIEDIERDAYYFTRKFNLTDEQEGAVFNILTEIVEEQKLIREESKQSSPEERLQLILAQTRAYREILQERMKEVMDNEQYQAFLEYEAESSSADMELWH